MSDKNMLFLSCTIKVVNIFCKKLLRLFRTRLWNDFRLSVMTNLFILCASYPWQESFITIIDKLSRNVMTFSDKERIKLTILLTSQFLETEHGHPTGELIMNCWFLLKILWQVLIISLHVYNQFVVICFKCSVSSSFVFESSTCDHNLSIL